jgi:hypothetical protein
MWARKGRDSSKERIDNQARKNLPEPKTLCDRPTPTNGGTVQKVGCPIYINSHLGRLGDQARLAPHSSDSKNLLKHHPPQRQEHSGIDKKAMEAPTDPDKPTFPAVGLAGHVILPLM